MLSTLLTVWIVLVLSAGATMLWRNEMVWRVRTRILGQNINEYYKLPRYEDMLWDFSKWREKDWTS